MIAKYRTGIICMTFAVLFILVGSALAEGEWAPIGDNDIHYTNTGNVGIGTTVPSVKLHVIGPDVTSSTGWKSEIIAGAANNYQSQRVGLGLDASGPRSGIGLMWQGNTLFKVDNIGNVGIGTTSPVANLDVHSTGANDSLLLIGAAGTGIAELVLDASNGDASGNDYLELYQTNDLDAHLRVAGGNGNLILQESGGNVGIGTINPDRKLQVDGSIGLSDKGYFQYNNTSYFPNNSGFHQQYAPSSQGFVFNLRSGSNSDDPIFKIQDSRVNAGSFVVNSRTGNVGIGTTDPQSKLSVKGTITAEEIKVTDAVGADFVFDEDYNLATLDEIESFILKNKHLPDIPSAREVETEGIAVSEMLVKQLQKIEEMTLYLIELKKGNEALKAKNAELEKRLAKLESGG